MPHYRGYRVLHSVMKIVPQARQLIMIRVPLVASLVAGSGLSPASCSVPSVPSSLCMPCPCEPVSLLLLLGSGSLFLPRRDPHHHLPAVPSAATAPPNFAPLTSCPLAPNFARWQTYFRLEHCQSRIAMQRHKSPQQFLPIQIQKELDWRKTPLPSIHRRCMR